MVVLSSRLDTETCLCSYTGACISLLRIKSSEEKMESSDGVPISTFLVLLSSLWTIYFFMGNFIVDKTVGVKE